MTEAEFEEFITLYDEINELMDADYATKTEHIQREWYTVEGVFDMYQYLRALAKHKITEVSHA